MSNKIKIVADSSSDYLSLEGIEFASAPLKIVNEFKEYIDDETLDLESFVSELKEYKGKVSTACPAPGDWIKAFGDAEYVIGVTISAELSGSYNSLLTAKDIYETEHPGRHVYAVNSISEGPGMQLIIRKLKELINKGMDFEDICEFIEGYKKNLGIYFLLANVHNLANNGRLNPLIAKVIGLLNIKLLGRGSDIGEIQIVEKCRGIKKGMPAIVKGLKDDGCKGTKISIGHVFNEHAANIVADMIRAVYPDAEIDIYQTRGLTSFYAEEGGIIVAFEKN